MAIIQYPKTQVSRPHVKISINANNLGGSNNASEKPLALVGQAEGGSPNEVYKFTSYQQAKAVLHGGNLLDALELAWNPSPDSLGAGAIYTVRVDSATQAQAQAEGLTIKSVTYGSVANGISAVLQDGADAFTKTLIIQDHNDGGIETYQDIGAILKITYSGEAALQTVAITDNTLTLSSGEDADTLVVDASYPLGQDGDYKTVASILAAIGSQEGWQAQYYSDTKNYPSEFLATVVTGTNPKEFVLTNIGYDIVQQTQYSSYITCTFNTATPVTKNFSVALAGGNDGEVPESWADQLGLLASEDVYYIVPLTDDAAIHSETAAFCDDQAENGHDMRAIVGGGISEPVNQLISRSASLKNARASLVANSGWYTFADGRQIDLPAYMIAAEIGGLKSGLAVAEPATFKYITLDSLDIYFNNSDLDNLYNNGVLSLEFVRNRTTTGFRICSDVTTYNDSTEPVLNNAATGELTDFLMSDLRYELENNFIGTKLHLNSASLMKNFVQSFLDAAKLDPDSMVVDYTPDDVKITIEGSTAYISFVVQPAVGLDLIDVSGTYEMFSSTTADNA